MDVDPDWPCLSHRTPDPLARRTRAPATSDCRCFACTPAQGKRWVVVPGPGDPAPGVMLPRPPLPSCLTAGFKVPASSSPLHLSGSPTIPWLPPCSTLPRVPVESYPPLAAACYHPAAQHTHRLLGSAWLLSRPTPTGSGASSEFTSNPCRLRWYTQVRRLFALCLIIASPYAPFKHRCPFLLP